MLTKSKKQMLTDNIKIFGNVKVLVITALFIAMSIVLGKFMSFTVGPIRLSFENLTVLMSGIFFGPVIGLVTGLVSDLIGCVLYGYTINPIITLGAGSIGLISGLISHFTFKSKPFVNTLLSVVVSHIIGSLIIKSIGLYLMYHSPMEVMIMRVPTYAIISAAEFYIIHMLMKNKALKGQLEKVYRR